MMLLSLSLAPVLIILFYVYFRDKYEKEPFNILVKCFCLSAMFSFPVALMEHLINRGWIKLGLATDGLAYAAYQSFFIAGFTEEMFKFIALVFLIWMRKEFNERFDGIVYAVFVSLGFAAVENLLYVFSRGAGVGFIRMFTAVPGHAVYGVTMGYYFGLAKFVPGKRGLYLSLSLIMPIALHGFYDFIIFSRIKFLLLLFIPYLGLLFRQCTIFMKEHSDNSEFAIKGKGTPLGTE